MSQTQRPWDSRFFETRKRRDSWRGEFFETEYQAEFPGFRESLPVEDNFFVPRKSSEKIDPKFFLSREF